MELFATMLDPIGMTETNEEKLNRLEKELQEKEKAKLNL